MASLIHELDNDALLLLYSAGELPDDDRAEVEQLLAVDLTLRARLAAVEHDMLSASAALAAVDVADPPVASPSAESVALRLVSRAMRQWQVERVVRGRPAAVVERQPRLPSWAYPVVAAAAVVVVTLAWWGVQSDPGTPVPVTPDAVASRTDDGAAGQPRPADLSGRLPLVADAIDGDGGLGGEGPNAGDGTGGGLVEAQHEAHMLARADDTLAMPTIVRDGLTD